MKYQAYSLITLLLLALGGVPAVAGEAPVIMPMDGKSDTESYQGEGKVNSVDIKAGRIRLTHGPIPGLGWKAMAMSFGVTDNSLLENLKPGQKVAFTLIEARRGKYLISEISVVK